MTHDVDRRLRDRPAAATEIEITPEMIEAAAEEIAGYSREDDPRIIAFSALRAALSRRAFGEPSPKYALSRGQFQKRKTKI